jgi:8-oxo-dGTP pyrophosphatase MutT (NUDIX family)
VAELRGVTTPSLLDRVAAALASRSPGLAERDEPFLEAAVALVLRPRPDDDCDLLLIRRAERAQDPWSGQVALPGGRRDPGDASLEAAALRETAEEVGLDLRTNGRVLGALSELRPRTPVLPPVIVRPFVVALDGTPALTPNVEVAAWRWVPLGALLAPAARVRTRVAVRGRDWEVDAIRHEDFIVWGMTERILADFATLLR